MKLYDQNGDECQMTGLPHMFYDKVAVHDELQKRNERVAELEKALRSVVDAYYDVDNRDLDRLPEAIEEANRVLKQVTHD